VTRRSKAGPEREAQAHAEGASGSSPKPSPGRAPRARAPRERLGPLPRPLALAALIAWALVTIIAFTGLLGAAPPWSGEREGLVPSLHRSAEGRSLALVRVDFEALAEREGEDAAEIGSETDPRTILAEAGIAIEEALGEERVPIAPPKTEITRWLDAHALYLLPIEAHDELAARLSDEAMLAQVQGLAARLSSPLYSVSGEQPRRDPLAIHELSKREAGRLGHVAEIPGSNAPQVSASGDLISAGGDRALIALVSERPASELLTDVEVALAELPVELALVDARLAEARVAEQLGSDWAKTIVACFAGLILLLAITMRRVIPVLVLAVCLASAWVITAWIALHFGFGGLGPGALDGLDLLSVALTIMLVGFACDAALRLQRIGLRGFVATLILAGALAPLALSPYPLWQRWALLWPLAYLITAVVMRVVLPALVELLRGDFEWRRPGFRLSPMPGVAVFVCLGLSAAGAFVTPQLSYRAPARLPLADHEQRALERELIEHFFDPTMIVEARSRPGPVDERPPELETPEAAALDAAAETVAALAGLVPIEARRVDSPGSFVLPHTELEARRQALAKLKLGERMEMLEVLLADRGLRPEAFAEFVRGAADIDDLPSAQAAIDGPLGPWIRGYFVNEGAGEGEDVELRTRVELRGREGLPVSAISEEQLAALPALRGPAIAAMIDQREFERRLGLVVVAGLWLTAFFVWLGTGSLGIALSAALVALSAQLGVMIALWLLEQPTGPHLLPVILLVGAAAGVAGGRACRAVSLGQPIVARGLLLAAACEVIAGGVLLSSGQPLWRELGLALAIGSALASGLGLFATPGLASMFTGRRRRPPADAGDSKERS
jgi:hypothetical protein